MQSVFGAVSVLTVSLGSCCVCVCVFLAQRSEHEQSGIPASSLDLLGDTPSSVCLICIPAEPKMESKSGFVFLPPNINHCNVVMHSVHITITLYM